MSQADKNLAVQAAYLAAHAKHPQWLSEKRLA